MKHDPRLHADGPWLRVLIASPSDAFDAACAVQREGRIVSRVLRGRKMRTWADLYDEIGAALQFPPYFGENGDALDECLADLEWLPADAYSLTILDALCVLDEERPKEERIFWEQLRDAAEHWGEAKPFRVVAQCTAEEEVGMRERLPTV